MDIKIPFNLPARVGKEKEYIEEVLEKRKLSGDGEFTRKCSEIMEKTFNAKKVLLTTSCTHALEMAAMLSGLSAGDEVIVPSYTFSSTVNSFMLRGAKPVFVDIREDTLNIDEKLIENNMTPKTKALFVVHYAGVACDMEKISQIARKHGLFVIEDAAQGINAKYKGRYLGTLGHFGAYSFHETKNCVCGEGGAIVINDNKFAERAEIIREKGTNRSKFFRGEVDKYSWVDEGSSYLPSDILAAYLYAQLENMEKIQKTREKIYNHYHKNLKYLESRNKIRLPIVPDYCNWNYHMFYILLPDEETRNKLMDYLKNRGILAIFHYLPLHLSVMGRRLGYKGGDLPVTEEMSGRLLRLPFYYDLKTEQQDFIIKSIYSFFGC